METQNPETPLVVITIDEKTLPHVFGAAFVLGVLAGAVVAACALAFIFT